MKVVINRCFGGFGLSDKAFARLNEGRMFPFEMAIGIPRDDRGLVHVVEEMGADANGYLASLSVIEIPDDATDWEIDEYDGLERIVYVVGGILHHAF